MDYSQESLQPADVCVSHGDKLKLELFDREHNLTRVQISHRKLIGKGTFGRVYKVHLAVEDASKKSLSRIFKRPKANACLKTTSCMNGLIVERDILLKVSSKFHLIDSTTRKVLN